MKTRLIEEEESRADCEVRRDGFDSTERF